MKKKLVGIELYRIVLTFGICYLHAITMCGHRAIGVGGRISYPLYSCVTGFVFITGWFGVSCSVIKMIKLWGVALYSVLVVSLIDVFLHGYSSGLEYWHVFVGNWFLNGYMVLLLLSPMVNMVVEKFHRERNGASAYAVGGLLFLVFIWAFLRTSPFVGRYIPISAGVEAYSGLTLVGIYMAARLCRAMDIERYLSEKRLVCIAVLSMVAILCHLSTYASPFTFMFAMIGFFAFKNITLSPLAAKVVITLSPSMFTVFLLHANFIGFGLMSQVESVLISRGYNMNIAFIVTALMVFLVGLLLDFPRRIVISVLRKHDMRQSSMLER